MKSACDKLHRCGTLVLVGAGIKRPRFDNNRILLNELVITGAYTYDADGIAAALELLSGAVACARSVIEPTDVSLNELLDAMNGLASVSSPAK